jgi:hypothetical protein
MHIEFEDGYVLMWLTPRTWTLPTVTFRTYPSVYLTVSCRNEELMYSFMMFAACTDA